MRFIDVRDTYLVLLGPWFFLTPIAYPRSILPEAAQLFVRYNPMTYKDAQAMEVELGIHLRAHGYGVWQG